MITSYDKVKTLYRSGRVKRLHCIPTVNQHNVAQHVYGSLLIGVELARAIAGVRLEAVMLALMYHDAAELKTGDLPAPTKRASLAIAQAIMLMEDEFDREHQIFVELTPPEQGVVKCADSLDLAFNALHELEMGNRTAHMARVFATALEYAAKPKVMGSDYFIQLLQHDWMRLKER